MIGLKSASTAKFIYNLLLPAVGVGLAYIVFVGRPLMHKVNEAQLRITKTAATAQDNPSAQLVASRAAEQQLKEELARLQSSQQRLTAQFKESTESSVQRMANLLALLERNGLKCSESVAISAEENQALGYSALKSSTVRLRLTGTFEQMRRAVDEMQVAPSCALLLSLNMQPCASADDAIHQWILIFLV